MDKQSDEEIDCTSDETYRHQSSERVVNSSEKRRHKLLVNNDNSRVYERDSMERFGDDLTEQVIQYLWLEEKVRFEYVCKQWQRLIFNKQAELHIKYRRNSDRKNSVHYLFRYKSFSIQFDRELLESMLKKCPNISRVDLSNNYNDVSLQLVTKHCRRVTKLVVNTHCNEECLMSFATKHGMWLQEFTIWPISDFTSDFMKQFLRLCPNITKINISLGQDISHIIETTTKLNVIKEVMIRANESHILEPVVRMYGKSLKELSIIIKRLSSDELKTCFAHISRFESLESLKILCELQNSTQAMNECLRLLAKKCIKLRKFDFDSHSNETSNRLLFAFSEFRSLERLVLKLSDIDTDNTPTFDGSIECMKNCIRLKHLTISYHELTQNFFADIQTILPNLRYLNIESEEIEGKSLKPFIESLQTMKYIESLVVNESKKFYYQKNRLESNSRILCRVVIEGEEYFVKKN